MITNAARDTQTVSIQLFATLKDKAGQRRIDVELAFPVTVKQMLTAVAAQYPKLGEMAMIALVAVNRAYADRDDVVSAEDEIALFPPVSGG